MVEPTNIIWALIIITGALIPIFTILIRIGKSQGIQTVTLENLKTGMDNLSKKIDQYELSNKDTVKRLWNAVEELQKQEKVQDKQLEYFEKAVNELNHHIMYKGGESNEH